MPLENVIGLIPISARPKDLKSKKFYNDVDFLSILVDTGGFPESFAKVDLFAESHNLDLFTTRWWYYLSDIERRIVAHKPLDSWEINKLTGRVKLLKNK